MPFNGSGTFSLTYTWATEAASPPIAISKLDTQEQDIAAGLSNCITRDGQSTITADIPFNGKRITNLGDATADTDALNRRSGDARYARLSQGNTFQAAQNFDSGGAAIRLKPGAIDNVVMELYARSAQPNVRSGWIGYDSPGSTGMHVTNEISGGLVGIHANNGPIVLDGTTVSVNGVNVRDAAILTSGSLDPARVPQNAVTQHQAALTIAETQITDGTILARVGANETISGSWTFSTRPKSSGAGGFLSYASATNTGGSITVSTSDPSGTPADGDLWFKREA